MSEDEAKLWFAERWSEQQCAKLEQFLAMVIEENERQNLIAPSTIASIWNRHALDSAQLVDLAPADATSWLDIGSGGGFPGIVVAIAFAGRVSLVEPRRRRAEFLSHAVERLGLTAEIIQSKVEHMSGAFDVISARAVASVEKLGVAAAARATTGTRWLLPRGTIEPTALRMLERRRAVFHVEQSLSDVGSSILVVDGVLA